ncbi:MAG: ZIP family metal transporter [Oscillospiraceae bacterium]
MRELLFAAIGTGATCFATILGSATVFFFKKGMKDLTQKIFLGFAAGVMIAASVWSLLIPAMNMAKEQGQMVAPPVAIGFVVGGVFLMLLDKVVPHLHIGSKETEGPHTKLQRNTMIVIAVTLHNIPEGMAVGLAFAVAAQSKDPGAFAGAVALAIGMGIQNFPEGAVISLPLKAGGTSSMKAFLCGAASGVVEPIFGILTVLVASTVTGIMPWILSFAAGAMIYVVVEELIPEAHLGEHSHAGTVSVMFGFLVMMMLDVFMT